MAQLDVSALDPVAAVATTLRDLIQLTEIFKTNDAIPPIEYMRSLEHVKETLDAITFMVITAMRMQVKDKIPSEVMEQFQGEKTATDLERLDWTVGQKIARVQKLLAPFSIDMDLTDLPPGMFPGSS